MNVANLREAATLCQSIAPFSPLCILSVKYGQCLLVWWVGRFFMKQQILVAITSRQVHVNRT